MFIIYDALAGLRTFLSKSLPFFVPVIPARFVVCEYETYLPNSGGVNSIEHSSTLLTRELVIYVSTWYALVTMENLLKTIIGPNFQGTLAILDREEMT